MPGVTGIEMAREIASIRPGVPVILCTCFSEAKTRQEAEAAGIRYFLSKPIMMREMAEVVRRAIDDAGGTTTGA
jgi:DNA-binding NtrC family response regulator